MKSRSSSLETGRETMEYIESPYLVKDYQMITKHLREKVHLDKLQGRRVKKGRLGTTTSLQHRGLHNYPMQYNREDIKSAKWNPERRKEKGVKMNIAKIDSTSLKQHSKDMFDYAVKSAPPKSDKKTENSAINDHMEKRRIRKTSVNSDISIALSRTGPTKDGSALYNNRARVLNSIRVRPHTDAGCRYNHERASSKQNLREAMSQKSSMYDVLELNQRRRIGSSSSYASSSLLLVPRSHDSVYSDILDAESYYRPSTVEDFLADPDVFDANISNDGSFYDWNDRERNNSVSKRNHDLLSPSTPCGVNLVTLNEESSSESEAEEAVPEVAKVEQPPAQTPKKTKAASQAPEVVEEAPPPPKLVLKGPPCWVDDATVTSSHPASEDIENVENDPANAGEPDTKRNNPATSKHIADNKNTGVADHKNTGVADNKNTGVADHKNTGVADHKNTGVADNKNTGVADHKNTGVADNKITGVAENKNTGVVDNKNTGVYIPNGVKCDPVPILQEYIEKDKEESVEDDAESIDTRLPSFLCPSSEKKSREAAIKDWLYSCNNLFVYPRAAPML